MTVATSEPDVCDKCLGKDEPVKCDGDYMTTDDFNKLENLIINKTEEMTNFVELRMKQLNGVVLKIDDRLKESNQKIIKELMKQKLQGDIWFSNLDEKIQDLYTDHAFLKANQKEMLSKLKGVSAQITALKAHLSTSTDDNTLQS